jgi:galactose oxidase-like protein/glyoxal oxidase-like protein
MARGQAGVGHSRRFLRSLVTLACALAVSLIGPVGDQALPSPRADPSIVGRWAEPIEIGVIGIHAAMLHTGKVLLYEFVGEGPGSAAILYDPASGSTKDVTLPGRRDIFCSGLSFMPDGRVLVTGGHLYGSASADGIRDVSIFDPATEAWASGRAMAKPRWYPSNVAMPDGTTLVLTGTARQGVLQRSMESFDPATQRWTTLPPSADSRSSMYSKVFVMTDGRLFRAGPDQATPIFDPTTNTWTSLTEMVFGDRGEGAAVLLPGLHEVLVAGGAGGAGGLSEITDTAEVIDLSAPTPSWSYSGSMNRPRAHLNLVLLPDGTVLAVGGGSRGWYGDPVLEAERFDPATGVWSLMAPQQVQRTYHSTAVLLPDGRVLSAGSDSGPRPTTIEIYSPPYLFQGRRPTITTSPNSLTYGQPFTIESPDAVDVSRVVLMRAGAVTHTNNFDQRYLELSFTLESGVVSALSPATPNEAPPGYYMLSIVDSAGVPSIATWVLVGS